MTPEQLEVLFPQIVKRLTLTLIDLMQQLDTHPIHSRDVEVLISSVQGSLGQLNKCYYGLIRAYAQGIIDAERAAREPNPTPS